MPLFWNTEASSVLPREGEQVQRPRGPLNLSTARKLSAEELMLLNCGVGEDS